MMKSITLKNREVIPIEEDEFLRINERYVSRCRIIKQTIVSLLELTLWKDTYEDGHEVIYFKPNQGGSLAFSGNYVILSEELKEKYPNLPQEIKLYDYDISKEKEINTL